MGDVCYRPLIADMTWSYSRLKTFETCQHYWFLKYIRGVKDLSCFYTTYGSFVHSILERYYTGKISKSQMLTAFLSGFSNSVRGRKPNAAIVNKYIRCGVDLFKDFKPLSFDTLWVEKPVKYRVGNREFVGFIDYLGRDENGDLYLVDHKSRDLKPRSGRKKPTAGDAELDDMLRQLYLYSVPVFEEFGEYPRYLCFDCFKSRSFIKEPFKKEQLDEALDWANKLIDKIEETEDFEANYNFFFCNWLCGVSDKCELFKEESG